MRTSRQTTNRTGGRRAARQTTSESRTVRSGRDRDVAGTDRADRSDRFERSRSDDTTGGRRDRTRVRRRDDASNSASRGPGRRVQATGVRRATRDDRVKRPVTGREGRREAEEAEVSEDFIAGRHPVLEALKSGRSINKLLVSEGSEGGSLTEILGKARAAGIVMQRVPRSRLDQIAGPHHQGVILYVAPHDYADLDDIIKRKTSRKQVVVLLDEVEDPYNLGAVLRSAEATGVTGVVIPKRRSVPLTGVVAKVAAGALEHVPVARVTNLVQAMERLQQEGYWVFGADADAKQLYTEVDFTGPVAIVIGAEGKGLSRLVKERCDYLIKLPMLGKLQSLNASVATGVLLYEVVRQRA